MELIKLFDVYIFIGILNACTYTLAYLNVTANYLLDIWYSKGERNENADPKENMYLNCYKILALIFFFIMITASINLIRGAIKVSLNSLIIFSKINKIKQLIFVYKKSTSLIAPWLLLSLCIVFYEAQFLWNELIFWFFYGYTQETLDIILGVFLIFGELCFIF